ncbi:hypothetical protein BDW22DRAFT_1433698 [Trametopsis cervina]|nr:hypothetical protein BDW22DRAFT_1433698 [Trametopsis cervina]
MVTRGDLGPALSLSARVFGFNLQPLHASLHSTSLRSPLDVSFTHCQAHAVSPSLVVPSLRSVQQLPSSGTRGLSTTHIAVAPLSLNCHCELVTLVALRAIGPVFVPATSPSVLYSRLCSRRPQDLTQWRGQLNCGYTVRPSYDAALTPRYIPVRCIYAQADHLGIMPRPSL